MSDILDISQMTEEDIKLQYITSALTAKWDIKKITTQKSLIQLARNVYLVKENGTKRLSEISCKTREILYAVGVDMTLKP